MTNPFEPDNEFVFLNEDEINPETKNYFRVRHYQALINKIIHYGYEEAFANIPAADYEFIASMKDISENRTLLEEKIISLQKEIPQFTIE